MTMAKRKSPKEKPEEEPDQAVKETAVEVAEDAPEVPKTTVEEKEETPEDKYRRAGRIAKQVREEILPQIKIGARAYDLCEAAESRIIELGGGIGFPTNISINEVAAHYTSPEDDALIINEGDIVKLDIGIHIDGYIADTAATVNFNPELESLVEASQEALNKALQLIRPKTNSKDLGKIIEDTIRSYGYRPIRDLSGHQLDEYILHGPKSLPNITVPHGSILEEGEAYALETFAST
ncbi:MAG: M24 family metallopeptidase, partial [Candidatus Thorarchaeota archaeon]